MKININDIEYNIDLEEYKSEIMWDLGLIEEEDCEECGDCDVDDFSNEELLEELQFRGVNTCSLLEDLSIVEYAFVEKLLLNIKDVDLNKLEELL